MKKRIFKEVADPEILRKKSLMDNRIILLFDDIDSCIIEETIEQLFLLASLGTEEITIFINTNGGAVIDGLALYDTMKMLPIDIRTICVGQAASLGAMILAAGTRGKRCIMPHGRVLIHQMTSGSRGKLSDVKTNLKESERLEKMVNQILANETGQPIKKIEKDQEKDFWMSAEEAIEYGIVDYKLQGIGRKQFKIITNQKQKGRRR